MKTNRNKIEKIDVILSRLNKVVKNITEKNRKHSGIINALK